MSEREAVTVWAHCSLKIVLRVTRPTQQEVAGFVLYAGAIPHDYTHPGAPGLEMLKHHAVSISAAARCLCVPTPGVEPGRPKGAAF